MTVLGAEDQAMGLSCGSVHARSRGGQVLWVAGPHPAVSSLGPSCRILWCTYQPFPASSPQWAREAERPARAQGNPGRLALPLLVPVTFRTGWRPWQVPGKFTGGLDVSALHYALCLFVQLFLCCLLSLQDLGLLCEVRAWRRQDNGQGLLATECFLGLSLGLSTACTTGHLREMCAP